MKGRRDNEKSFIYAKLYDYWSGSSVNSSFYNWIFSKLKKSESSEFKDSPFSSRMELKCLDIRSYTNGISLVLLRLVSSCIVSPSVIVVPVFAMV